MRLGGVTEEGCGIGMKGLALSRARLKTGQWGVEGCGPDLPSGPFKALSVISVLSKELPLRPWNEIK